MSPPIAKAARPAAPAVTDHASRAGTVPRGKPPLTPFRALLERPPMASAGPVPMRSLSHPPAVLTPSRERPGKPALDDGRSCPAEPMARSSTSPPMAEALPLAPFRVDPALLPSPPPPSAPAVRHDEIAFAAASELLESMRVGRFGRDGHAVSLRLRLPTGLASVELREEGGALRLRLEGASAELGERMREELASRGLMLEELEVA